MSDSDELVTLDEGKRGSTASPTSYGTVSSSGLRADGRHVDSGFLYTPDDLYDMVKSQDRAKLKSRWGGLDTIAKELKTNLKDGLSEHNDIVHRREVFGENRTPEAPHASWLELFMGAFEDVAVIILSIAAVVALVAGLLEQFLLAEPGHTDHNWIEGVAILAAVLIVATVTATNDYMKDIQFRKLKKQSANRKVRVIRNGEEHAIPIFDVVVGDVVSLYRGDQISCDGLLIPGLETLSVDESALTGEPDAKEKDDKHPFLFSGTFIAKGSGRMLCTSVGSSSEWGRTMALLADDHPDTPLQEKLEELVVLIGKIGTAVAAVVFLVLCGYYIAQYVVNPHDIVPCVDTLNTSFNGTQYLCNDPSGTPVPGEDHMISIPGKWRPESLMQILKAFIIAVTIVVVAVPEGLPLAVTISLAYSVSQMAEDQNLVRHLSACETMGGATNICSDKTGTLTENRMTVVELWVAGIGFSIRELDQNQQSAPVQQALIEGITLNNDDGELDKSGGQVVFLGNTTECALLVLSEKLKVDYKKLQKANPPAFKWGFTSLRKRMSSVIKKDGDVYRLYSKGAAEMVLAISSHVLKPDGSSEVMQEGLRKKLRQSIDEMAAKGLRTIGVAYRDFNGNQDWESAVDGVGLEDNLTMVALLAIEDPIRVEVPESVRLCQGAGIIVRMVTGDNILTAKKIAAECNILQEGGLALEGPVFEKMKDEELARILPNLQVLARSSPADKFRLVGKLMEMGEVVAVTGDGTNDGPALRAADVGLAMGITGTEVAKEAADIIILDDNFASIVKSVKWGRCVYDNIRKFLQFQLTVNVVALTVAFIGAVSNFGTPLTAVQLLWVNLIMDTMAALALGTEKPTDRLLLRKPYGRTGKLITMVMIRNILGQSAFQLGVLFSILYAVDKNGNHLMFPGVLSGQALDKEGLPSVHYTMVFNTFVLMQVFNEINSRKVDLQKNVFEGIFTNWIFVGIICTTVVVQILIVQFGGQAIRCAPLNWIQWLYCVGIAYFSLPWGFILRLIPVPLEEWEKEYEPVHY